VSTCDARRCNPSSAPRSDTNPKERENKELKKTGIIVAILAMTILLVPTVIHMPTVYAVKGISFVKSASANFTDANYHIAVPIRTTAGNFIGVIVQNSPYCPQFL
jgi:hypothetical protein